MLTLRTQIDEYYDCLDEDCEKCDEVDFYGSDS